MSFLSSLVLFCSLSVLFSGSPVSAQTYSQFAQNTFICSGSLYFQEFTDFYQIVLNGNSGSTQLLGSDGISLNGIGFSVNDSTIYTVDINGGVIYKLNSALQTYAMSPCVYPANQNNGLLSSLVSFVGVNRGDVDALGVFWVLGTYGGVSTLFGLDLVSNPTGCTILYQDDRTYFLPVGKDFSFIPLDGAVYSFVSKTAYLQRVQFLNTIYPGGWNGHNTLPVPSGQSAGAAELYSITGSNVPSGDVVATFVTAQNFFMGFDSGSNNIYGYDVSTLGYTTSTVSGVLVDAVSNKVTSGDGASCPYLIYTTLVASSYTPTIGIPFNLTVTLLNQYLSPLSPQLTLPLPSGVQYTGGAISYSNSSEAPSSVNYSNGNLIFSNANIPRKGSLSITIPVVGTALGSYQAQGSTYNLPKNLGNSVLTNWPGTSTPFAPTPFQVIAPSPSAANANGTITNATTITNLVTSSSNPTAPVSTVVTVSNSGPGNLLINNIVLPAGFSFANVPANGTIIAPGGSQSITVTYTPNPASSSVSGNIVVNTNNPSGSLVIPLFGQTTGPQIAVSTTAGAAETSGVSTVNFGSTTVGTPVNQTLNIANTGSAPMTINSISLPANVQASYLINGVYTPVSSTPVVPTSGSIQLVMTYNPTVLGNLNGNLVINSNSNLNSSFVVGLQGSAYGPQIQVTSSSGSTLSNSTTLQFSNTSENTASTQQVTITNTGNATLNLSNLSVSGTGYSIVSGPSTTSLAPGQSTTVTVSLKSSTPSTYTGALSISSNDNSNSAISIPLSGTVVDPVLVMTQSSTGASLATGSTINFPNIVVGGAETQTIVFSNTGNQNLNISSLNIPSGFYYAGGNMSSTGGIIAPGQSLTLVLGINTTSAQNINSVLSFNSNDPNQVNNGIYLKGTVGSGSASISATDGSGNSYQVSNSPSSIVIAGYAFVGGSASRTISFTNTGSTYLYIYNSSLPNGIYFSPSVPSSGLAIAPGATTNITVSFNTQTDGVVGGLLTLNTSDPNNNPYQFKIYGYIFSWNFTTPFANGTTLYHMYMSSGIKWQHDIGAHNVSLSIMDKTGSTLQVALVSNRDGTLLSFNFTPSTIVPGKYTIQAVISNIQNPNLQQYNGKKFISPVFTLST